MGLQIPHDNKLEQDDQPICKNVDLSLPKTDPHHVLLHIPFLSEFELASTLFNLELLNPFHPMQFDFSSDEKKLSSQLDNNESCGAPRLHKFTSQQDLRKEILQSWSSSLVSTVLFLALFYTICSSLLPLQKQHIHRFSMWLSLLGLFGFVVFVCAVAVMILVGAVFTRVQKAMLITWLVLMQLQSANSILDICVILFWGFFMAWYAFVKKEISNNESDMNKDANKLSAQTII